MNVKFACVATLLTSTVFAQAPQRGLLYTPRHQETSQQCAGTPALNEVRSNEVQYVVPDPASPYDSEQFAPLQAYTTMIGDNNLDGLYWEPHLFGEQPTVAGEDFTGIDALLRARDSQGRAIRPVNARNLFLSSSATVNHCLGAAAGYPITSGDIKLPKTLALVGMMGVGKTAIGRRLATRLDLPFVDADDEIEAAAGCSIEDIFENYGEVAFRDGEHRVIDRLLNDPVHIMATGGGAFVNAATRLEINRRGISLWLRADLDVLWRRVNRRSDRPMLKTPDPRATLAKLIETR